MDVDESPRFAGSARPRHMAIWMCKVSAGNLHANSFCQLIMLIERWMLLTVSDRARQQSTHQNVCPLQEISTICRIKLQFESHCVCVRKKQ